jgi:acetyl esterase/lipase
MPLDPHAERLLEMLAVAVPAKRARAGAGQPDTTARRQAFENLLRLGGAPEPVGSIENFAAPGPGGPIPLRQYTPLRPVAEPAPALVYFHGGGMVAGSLDSYDAVCRTLANAGCCRVVAVGYRLAPESPFPAALEDGCAALSWLFSQSVPLRIDPRRVGVGGDSAGANLAAVVCQLFRHVPAQKLALQLLLCPILDVGAETDSRRSFAAGYLIDLEDHAQELQDYLPAGADRTDPRVSPLRTADLAGLPVTHIHTAEFDPMRDEGLAYAERLRGAEVEVYYTCHAGMIHLFYALTGLIPAAGTALRGIAAQMAPALATGLA